MVKNLPAMQEIQVRPPGWEDPLNKGMATHSSILVYRISWTEEPGRLQSMRWQRVRLPWWLSTKESACQCRRRGSIPGSGRSPGERSGNPLQYSCPGKSHGQRSLVSYSPWGRKESDTTKQLNNINRLNTTQSRTQGSFPSFSGT